MTSLKEGFSSWSLVLFLWCILVSIIGILSGYIFRMTVLKIVFGLVIGAILYHAARSFFKSIATLSEQYSERYENSSFLEKFALVPSFIIESFFIKWRSDNHSAREMTSIRLSGLILCFWLGVQIINEYLP